MTLTERRLPVLLLAACWLFPAPGNLASAQDLPDDLSARIIPYQAVYQARSAGLSATAERSLHQLESGVFELSQAMTVRVLGARLGAIEEISHVAYEAGSVVPMSYSYTQSGLSSSAEHVQFNWLDMQATSREDDARTSLPLQTGVVDKLSFQLALRLSLMDSQVTDVAISMVDGDEIETHHYRVVASETVETGLGKLDTLKIQRVREPGSRRQTTFWLARDWHMLLVRFVQTSGSGSTTELLLEEATIDGQQVTPLP